MKAERPNKYPGQCTGCLRHIAAEAGVFEAVGDPAIRHTRVRCWKCVMAKRTDAYRDREREFGSIWNDLGTALSDDPAEFLIFHDDQWKAALTATQMQGLMLMIKGGCLARD